MWLVFKVHYVSSGTFPYQETCQGSKWFYYLRIVQVGMATHLHLNYSSIVY